MNRLQKKCFIGSAGCHLLLALILFVGPAFVSSKSKIDDMAVLDFVPLKTTDALVAPGGGNPAAGSPPAAQPQTSPAPPPKPLKAPDPEPPKEVMKETKPPEPEESLDLGQETKPKKKPIELKPVTRNTRDEAKARADAQAKQEAKAYADAQREIAGRLGRVADHLGNSLSGSTSVGLVGPGGGGLPYANFLQAVKSAYANAWVVPDGVSDDNATATVSVTIARDGKVTTHRLTQPSGDSAVDGSVQEVLQRVTYAAPLPDDAKEDHRTVTIRFNVKMKRGF